MGSVWFDTATIQSTPADDFTPGAQYDTVVAGAGLTGLATAVLLARAGQRVAVLEARSLAAVTTGHTTGKVSLLQGTTLSQIGSYHSRNVVQAYVDGNREAMAWLLEYLQERGIDAPRRTAYTYATRPAALSKLRAELRAAQDAGLGVTWETDLDLPFAVAGAVALADQAQINAVDAARALAAELRLLGGIRVEGVRVTGASHGANLTVATDAGEVRADRLVLATGTPILDRGGYFAKLSPQRSYAMTYRLGDGGAQLPTGMYLSVDQPSRSLRTVEDGDDRLLLVGGNGHTVGRARSPQAAVDDLERWVQGHYPGARRTHSWSAQDYQSVNKVPFVGALPRGGGRIFVATGYSKWGMTNAVAAALALSGEILSAPRPWARTLGRRVTKPRGLLDLAGINADVGAYLAGGWLVAELSTVPAADPEEGAGVVGRDGLEPVAVSTVHGRTCRVSAVCPHLGGIVRWNDAEKSWDCPLHGSRFAADGAVLEGPAVSVLQPRDRA